MAIDKIEEGEKNEKVDLLQCLVLAHGRLF
jgi:hypothetical protein